MPQQLSVTASSPSSGVSDGSTRDWPEHAVTVLDQADRRQFIEALMKASSAASKLAIAAHTPNRKRCRSEWLTEMRRMAEPC